MSSGKEHALRQNTRYFDSKTCQIKLVAFDVDGVFSDGRIYIGNDGEEIKAFHTLDGYGIKALLQNGIEVAVITGRRSNIVQQRMDSLGVTHLVQGEEAKATALANLQTQLGIPKQHTCSMGDDIPDTGMFFHSSLAITVPGAHPALLDSADYITQRKGGFGAVRELCDLILLSQNKLGGIQGSSI